MDKEGRILTKDWSKYDLNNVVFQPKHMTPKELKDGVNRIRKRFYSVQHTVRRILHCANTSKGFSNLLMRFSSNFVMRNFSLMDELRGVIK